MYLKNLHLKDFRNYHEQKVEFTAAKTILVGDNAQGKSNLLEAVELLATLRSHRLGKDSDFIRVGTETGQINASLERLTGWTDLSLILRRHGRRSVAINGESLRRQLDFLGVLNAVQFSSLDLDLVRGSPDTRRNWLDTLLIQLEPVYARILQEYNRVLRQRNAFLKQLMAPEKASELPQPNDLGYSTLPIWDAQLVSSGTRVIRRRQRAIERLAPIAAAWHANISNSTEVLKINYLPNVPLQQNHQPEVQKAFLAKIQHRQAAELSRGTTLVGPHRDEIELMINQTPAREYGSQGQQRTLVLALKLAELQLIDEVVQEPPLLLLDDVLAELDSTRQNQLLDAIENRFQTLITTTHLNSFEQKWLNSTEIMFVKCGKIL